MRTLPGTTLQVSRLCLGGNVFGRAVDAASQPARVLDAFLDQGGNFIDTADVYGEGQSETLIGRWLATRPRDQVVLATKVGAWPPLMGLSPEAIRRGIEGSLTRLGTDYLDLFYAHQDDLETPIAETIAAFDALVREGKVRYIAASNFSASRLAEALDTSEKLGMARYVALQPRYNLVQRDEFEGPLQDLCGTRGLSCLPHSGLAKGFLTGKFRRAEDVDDRPRAQSASVHLDARGLRALEALDRVAAAHQTTTAAAALSWLAAQPTVVAPLASARTAEQVADLVPALTLDLSTEELLALSAFDA